MANVAVVVVCDPPSPQALATSSSISLTICARAAGCLGFRRVGPTASGDFGFIRRMHQAAVRHLKLSDPVMAKVVDLVGPCRFRPIADATHFHHLARAIVYQQLSTKAATTIFGRVQTLCGGALEPAAILSQHDDALRGAGLSGQKARYIKDLAAHVRDDRLPLDRVEAMDDGEVVAALTEVKGIGVWSAQMFLIFRLGRLDVLPVLDLGIRKGVQRAYGVRRLPAPGYVERLGKRWSPYATIASWYLWRLLDQPVQA